MCSSLWGVFFRSVVFYKISQDTNFLLDVVKVVKVIELSQSKLAVVIIQTFLRNTHNFRSLLKV